jgi:hypothetical protein
MAAKAVQSPFGAEFRSSLADDWSWKQSQPIPGFKTVRNRLDYRRCIPVLVHWRDVNCDGAFRSYALFEVAEAGSVVIGKRSSRSAILQNASNPVFHKFCTGIEQRRVLAMPLHQIAFVCSGVLLVPLPFIQVTMRGQVHDANYGLGSPEIRPWDMRFVNPVFGQHGIWNLHKRAYKRRALRSAFIVFPSSSFPCWLL